MKYFGHICSFLHYLLIFERCYILKLNNLQYSPASFPSLEPGIQLFGAFWRDLNKSYVLIAFITIVNSRAVSYIGFTWIARIPGGSEFTQPRAISDIFQAWDMFCSYCVTWGPARHKPVLGKVALVATRLPWDGDHLIRMRPPLRCSHPYTCTSTGLDQIVWHTCSSSSD